MCIYITACVFNIIKSFTFSLEKAEKNYHTQIAEHLQQIRQLQVELQKEKGEREIVETDKNRLRTETDQIIATATAENKDLKNQLNELDKLLSENQGLFWYPSL